jgi:hypothetical protein
MGRQRKSREACFGAWPKIWPGEWLHLPLIRLSRYASVGGADLRKEA